MDNLQPTPKRHHPARESDDQRDDTLRYEYSKGYLPMENPKGMDGEPTEIR